MSVIPVTVKWMGKQNFENIDLDTSESPATFKAQLFALSGVQPERIKLMIKGKMVKDDQSWKEFNVQSGAQFTMMGTAETVVAPEKKPVFLEDMSAEQADMALNYGLPSGLVNLDNTCYMNSTVEMLRTVPELKSALLSYVSPAGAFDGQVSLTTAFRDVIGQLEISRDAVTPRTFFSILRQVFPQFAQTGQHGENMQQDAEECLSQVLSTLSFQLKSKRSSAEPAGPASADGAPAGNVVDDLFTIEFEEKTTCKEAPEEQASSGKVSTKKISVFIKSQMTHLYEGIKNSLQDDVEKHSPSLGRVAMYQRNLAISRLPPYLFVQFVRFEWKAGAGKEHKGVKAKILKRITFPFYLDMKEYCTDSLKDAISRRRDELAVSAPSTAPPAVQCTDTGLYELCAVITHLGRDADGGHYIAWTKSDNGKWLKFDDDVVTEQPEEEIMKLVGGGDWHTAYVCLYRATTQKEKSQPAKKIKSSE